jgi:malate dehydrogenase (oxaloacetate-decarboxylating)
MAKVTNPRGVTGALADALKGANAFIGVSAANVVSREMVSSMAKDPIVFAMANPSPEIMPEDALAAGAAIVGTGRSDYPNQINNVLAFPGIFRGAFDCGAKTITEDMKLAAAQAIANVLGEDERGRERIMPNAFDPRVATAVADAVKSAAKE